MAYYTPLIVLVWFSLCILCILVKENDRLGKKEKIILYFTYLTVALAAFFEWLGIQLNGNTEISAWLIRAAKLFDYILTPLAGGAIILQFKNKSVWRKIIFFVISINTVFQIVSFFTGWMINIDANNRYVHGSGYNTYSFFYVLITTLVIIEFAVYGRKFRRQNRFSLFASLAFVLAGIVMQEVMGSEVRTAYVSLTMCLAFLYIHNSEFAQLVSDDRIREQTIKISEDPLTGISSRYAYTAALQEFSSMEKLPDDFVVFSIDINGLKAANDTLGHNAGDELICGAATCIDSVFSPYGQCFRTGGDEFIVFAKIDGNDVADDLETRLAKKADAWHGKEVKSLSLAFGRAGASDNPDVPIEKLVYLADKEMYKAKDEYYRSTGIDRRKI